MLPFREKNYKRLLGLGGENPKLLGFAPQAPLLGGGLAPHIPYFPNITFLT